VTQTAATGPLSALIASGDLTLGVPVPVPVLVVAAAAAAVVAWCVGWFGPAAAATEKERRRADRARAMSSAWASPEDLGPLACRGAPEPSRLQLGMLGKAVVANPPRRPVMVVAPTGAGKTPRIAVPMVLRHRGPTVITSVKADILHLTRHHRATQGPVWVFDITGISGLSSCRWSPLAGVHSDADAMKAAAWLSDSSKVGSKGIEEQRFWDSLGEKMLAPLVFAAARTGQHIASVSRWVDHQAEDDVQLILDDQGDPDAIAAWSATCGRVDRTKASVFGTGETVLQPFSHPEVRAALTIPRQQPASDVEVFSPARLLDEGGTLYLVAPAHDQELFTPVFETLTNAILREVEQRSARNAGLPVDPPLLLCLDEAANCAPLRRLDRVASAGANQGIITASFWQDEGQIAEIYGDRRARTVMSNHTARMFLPGISDDQTLRSLSEAIGDHRVRHVTTGRDAGAAGRGRRSTSTSYTDERLAPVSYLRRTPTGTAIVLTGQTKPMRLQVPGWWEQPDLARLVHRDVRRAYHRQFGATT
jgi:type IV secretory pathway TraG/TraD family ATPase VirD4